MKVLFLLAVAFLGASALQSNTTTVTDWAKDTSFSFWEASVTPTVPYPDGRYIINGPKQIRWDNQTRRPDGIVFVPTGMESKPAPARAPSGRARSKPEMEMFNLPVSSPAKNLNSAKSDPAKKSEMPDLGILGQKKQVSNVNTDEILSYFQKSDITTEKGNEKIGAILNVDTNPKLDVPPPSSATFESK